MAVFTDENGNACATVDGLGNHCPGILLHFVSDGVYLCSNCHKVYSNIPEPNLKGMVESGEWRSPTQEEMNSILPKE